MLKEELELELEVGRWWWVLSLTAELELYMSPSRSCMSLRPTVIIESMLSMSSSDGKTSTASALRYRNSTTHRIRIAYVLSISSAGPVAESVGACAVSQSVGAWLVGWLAGWRSALNS